MSPEQLLERIKTLGIEIDPVVFKKIQNQLDDPVKKVKAKGILRYLLKKDQITQEQADELSKPVEAAVDEFKVDDQPKENDFDTDDLTGLIQESEVVEEPAKPVSSKKAKRKKKPSSAKKDPVDHGQTIMDQGQLDPQQDEIVEGNIEQIEHVEAFDEIEAHHEFGDDSQAPAGQKAEGLGFVGKRNLKDQWSTKWLFIGFGILGVLFIAGAVLAIATMGVKAEDQYKAAEHSMHTLAYQDAAKKFQDYIDDNPSHKSVPEAKAYRVKCILRSSDASRNWVEVISAAQKLLPELSEPEESKIEIIRDDLGVVLTRALFFITEKAKKLEQLADLESILSKIREYKKVVDNPIYVTSSSRKSSSIAGIIAKTENNIRTIVDKIDREKDYLAAMFEIRQQRDRGETDNAFKTYTKLVRNYGDLAGRQELRDTMLQVSLKERELVKPFVPQLVVQQGRRDSIIESSVVLSAQSGNSVENLQGEVVNFLVDGSVYGMDAGDGRIIWRNFVGYQTTIQPQSLGEDNILIADQNRNDLLSVQKSTGEVVWRTEIGEPFLTPALNDTQIVLTTESGKLIQVDRESGQALLATTLPQKTTVSALVADRDPVIYQPGSYSNLYVISSQDFTCREVYYLGHYKGSIAVPPQSWSGYILVAVNGGDYCDLLVLRPKQNGLELELVQTISRVTDSTVTTPIQKFGRGMMLIGDEGEVRILELVPTDEQNPVRKFTSDRFDNSSGQKAYVLTAKSQLWIAGQGISQFRIRRAQGQLQRKDIVEHADSFLAPLQSLDDYIFHIRRRKGSGMLSASLAAADTLEPVWRTDFGGQLAGSLQSRDNAVIAVSHQGDYFQLEASNLQSGLASNAVKASTVVEDLQFDNLFSLPDGALLCTGPAGKEDILYVSAVGEKSKLLQLSPPANTFNCPPIVLDGDLIIASSEGQVVRVDPSSGRMIGIPFQPPISPGSITKWVEPTLVGDGLLAIAAGKANSGSTESLFYLLDCTNRTEIKMIGKLSSENEFKNRLVSWGNVVYAVVETASQDQLLQISTDSQPAIANQTDLPGRVVAGPWQMESGIMMLMDNDELLMVGDDLKTRWTLPVGSVKIAGHPQQMGSQILLSFQTGTLLLLDPQSGKLVSQHELGQPIVSHPVHVGTSLIFSGMDGTVHAVNLDQLSSTGNSVP